MEDRVETLNSDMVRRLIWFISTMIWWRGSVDTSRRNRLKCAPPLGSFGDTGITGNLDNSGDSSAGETYALFHRQTPGKWQDVQSEVRVCSVRADGIERASRCPLPQGGIDMVQCAYKMSLERTNRGPQGVKRTFPITVWPRFGE